MRKINSQIKSKESLLEQILESKQKIQQYQILEKEFFSIAQDLEKAQSSFKIEQKDQKILLNPKIIKNQRQLKKLQQSSKLTSKLLSFGNNSSKKAKVYEKQNKLNRLLRQSAQRENKMKKIQLQLNNYTACLDRKNIQVSSECKIGNDLWQKEQQLDQKIRKIEISFKEEKNKLKGKVQNIEMFEFECKKLKDNLEKNHPEPQAQQECIKTKEQPFKDVIYLKKSIQSEIQIATLEQQKFHFSIPSEQIISEPYMQQLSILLERKQKTARHKQVLNQRILEVNNEFNTLKTLMKHHKMTLQTIQKQNQYYDKAKKQERTNFLNQQIKMDKMGQKSRNLGGNKGQLRGKIALKIQRQRLVKLVNNGINRDLSIIKTSVNCLEGYKQIFRNNIKNFNIESTAK